jgi:BolA protein
MTQNAPRASRLIDTLSAAFRPSVIKVTDDSIHHAGHAGAGPSGETHFSVLLVSERFRGMTRVARSRAVHAALAEEFGEPSAGGMHALALTLRTPEEHEILTTSVG